MNNDKKTVEFDLNPTKENGQENGLVYQKGAKQIVRFNLDKEPKIVPWRQNNYVN